MMYLLHLVRNDFRLAYRDPIMRLILAMPLMILLLIWFVAPLLLLRFPIISHYQHVLLMWACLQTPVMFGFINGFLFLEEKEHGVHQALQVLPVSAGDLLLNRNLLGMVSSFLLNLLLLLSSGLIVADLLPALLLALQYSLLGPTLSLLLLTFAQNKVQGMAQFKVYNLLAILPALVYFLPQWWAHLLAFIPTYWSFRSIGMLPQEGWLMPLTIGFGVYALLLSCLLVMLQKRSH